MPGISSVPKRMKKAFPVVLMFSFLIMEPVDKRLVKSFRLTFSAGVGRCLSSIVPYQAQDMEHWKACLPTVVHYRSKETLVSRRASTMHLRTSARRVCFCPFSRRLHGWFMKTVGSDDDKAVAQFCLRQRAQSVLGHKVKGAIRCEQL